MGAASFFIFAAQCKLPLTLSNFGLHKQQAVWCLTCAHPVSMHRDTYLAR